MRARCWSGNGLFFGDFEYANLGVTNRVREVVDIDRLDVGFALVKIQMLNVVLLPLMDVDRFRMHGCERRREIDFADHVRLTPVFAGRIDDDEVVGRDRTQADRVRRIGFVDPMPVSAALMQEPGFAQLLTQSRYINIAKSLVRRDRQLEPGALQVVDENLKIVRLNVGMLGRLSEEVVRMLDDELVERSR